jgi:hypothetical protein
LDYSPKPGGKPPFDLIEEGLGIGLISCGPLTDFLPDIRQRAVDFGKLRVGDVTGPAARIGGLKIIEHYLGFDRAGRRTILPVQCPAYAVAFVGRRNLFEALRKVSVEASIEMCESCRNPVWQIDRRAVLLSISVLSRDDFALPRKKAYPIFDFGETVFDFLRNAAIMLRGWATPVRQSTLPKTRFIGPLRSYILSQHGGPSSKS